MSDPQLLVYRQASRTCETCGGHDNIVGGVWNGEDCPDCIDGRVTVPTTRPHCGMRHLTDLDRFRGYTEPECDHHHVPAPWAVILPGDPIVELDENSQPLDGNSSRYVIIGLHPEWGWQIRNIFSGLSSYCDYIHEFALDLDRIGDNPTRRAIPELMP